LKAEEKPWGITVEQEPRPTIIIKKGKMQNTNFYGNNYIVSPIPKCENCLVILNIKKRSMLEINSGERS
jgi:hypothetical protein